MEISIEFQEELGKNNERLEAALQEKTLDFEEMKRRLIKAVRYVSLRRSMFERISPS